MPTIQKQTIKRTPQSSGGILGNAVDVADIENDYIKLVLYGQNRVGKTTLACEFPKPLLLISFEPGQAGGAKSVKKVPGVRYLRLTSSADTVALAKELKTDKTYKTHVIDTATSCQDMVLRELMNLEEVPVQLNWGTVSQDIYRERSEKTKELLRPFRDLPANTIYCAQEKDHNPPQDNRNKLTRSLQIESFFASDLGSATVKFLHDSCDYIGRLYLDKETITKRIETKVNGKPVVREEEVETGKIVRRLRTMFHPNFAAGFRSENPGSVPEYIQAATPREMYDKIMKVIRGEKLT